MSTTDPNNTSVNSGVPGNTTNRAALSDKSPLTAASGRSAPHLNHRHSSQNCRRHFLAVFATSLALGAFFVTGCDRKTSEGKNAEVAKSEFAEFPIHLSDEAFFELCKTTNDPSQIIAARKGGSNPNAKRESGETPLHVAAKYNTNPKIITALIKIGAEVNAKATEKGVGGITPLLYAIGNNPNVEITATLIKAGADVNAKLTSGDEIGMTPLHVAVCHPNVEIITILIKAGADVNVKVPSGRNAGWTPLHNAKPRGANPEAITALIKAGADVNAVLDENRNYTPLHGMLTMGKDEKRIEIAKILIKAGAKIDEYSAERLREWGVSF
jgi:ankyrin repeat protein